MGEALGTEGGMPAEVARALRVSYVNLPPRSVRWTTIAGRQFQTLLFQSVDRYGAASTAKALGLARPSIAAALKAKTVKDVDAIAWPSRDELIELRKAWADVQNLNGRRVAVRSGSREFRAMQRALDALQSKYPMDVLSRAAGIELRRLRKYGQT